MWAWRHVVEVIFSGYIYGRILKETHKYFYNKGIDSIFQLKIIFKICVEQIYVTSAKLF